MPDATIANGIRRKYNALVEDLDERGRRRWAATEAESIGYGGTADANVRSWLREQPEPITKTGFSRTQLRKNS